MIVLSSRFPEKRLIRFRWLASGSIWWDSSWELDWGMVCWLEDLGLGLGFRNGSSKFWLIELVDLGITTESVGMSLG